MFALPASASATEIVFELAVENVRGVSTAVLCIPGTVIWGSLVRGCERWRRAEREQGHRGCERTHESPPACTSNVHQHRP